MAGAQAEGANRKTAARVSTFATTGIIPTVSTLGRARVMVATMVIGLGADVMTATAVAVATAAGAVAIAAAMAGMADN